MERLNIFQNQSQPINVATNLLGIVCDEYIYQTASNQWVTLCNLILMDEFTQQAIHVGEMNS